MLGVLGRSHQRTCLQSIPSVERKVCIKRNPITEHQRSLKTRFFSGDREPPPIRAAIVKIKTKENYSRTSPSTWEYTEYSLNNVHEDCMRTVEARWMAAKEECPSDQYYSTIVVTSSSTLTVSSRTLTLRTGTLVGITANS